MQQQRRKWSDKKRRQRQSLTLEQRGHKNAKRRSNYACRCEDNVVDSHENQPQLTSAEGHCMIQNPNDSSNTSKVRSLMTYITNYYHTVNGDGRRILDVYSLLHYCITNIFLNESL